MAKIDGTNGLIQAYSYQNPTTGFSYTIPSGTQTVLLDPAGTLATGTVVMPASPVDGMVVIITSTQQITTMTFSPNTGQSIVGNTATLPASQAVEFMYRQSNSTWYNLGVLAVAGKGPAFSAYQSSAQTLSNTTWTKIQFQTKEFDTANCFDATTNYRFTPTVAGYYQVNGGFVVASSGTQMNSRIYKNGTSAKSGTTAASQYGSTVSALIYLNGSTDYVELYGYVVTGQGLLASSDNTYFQASMVRSA
jgi:hypothetical protein